MTNIETANEFFAHYVSAFPATTEAERCAAYQGMQRLLDDNVHFTDMAYDMTGKKVFAMWHWFCTKKPAPVKVTYKPDDIKEEGGKVIVPYRAEYVFGYDEEKPNSGKNINYLITAHLTITGEKIVHHEDEADIKEWSGQAFNGLVSSISWTPIFKMGLRSKANALLDKFIEDHPEYQG